MAIGSLISCRNFGSFVGSGKLYEKEPVIFQWKGERSGISVLRNTQGNMWNQRLRSPMANGLISEHANCSMLHVWGNSDEKALKHIANCHTGKEHPLFLQCNEKFNRIYPWKRTNNKCECYFSSRHSLGGWFQPKAEDRIGTRKGKSPQSLDVKEDRICAFYKSDEYDITEAKVDSLQSTEIPSEAVLPDGDLQETSPWWEQFPKRWVVVLLCFSAFLLCNMDRIVGGIWADKFGGKPVLGFGVIWWSVATVLTPVAARIGLPFLLIMRAFMGIGEGVAMPAMNNMLSKWIPVSERSRSLAFVYSGMYLGSVTGLAVSPILIQKFGWPSVFYSFGSLGSIWFALWLKKAYSSPKEDPELRAEEKRHILGGSISKEAVSVIPWKLILSKAPVWALIISHFCHNWGTFILLTWMPTYYNQVLKFNLTESGLFCVLPWLTMAVFANMGGWIADTLVSKGLSITAVRKIMQSIGFLGPAFFLTQLSHVRTPAMAVLCMACSQGSDAFSQSGLYSNHQDIGPRYAGVLLGLSNTAGVLAGVFGTAATGYILQRGSWDDVFKVAVVLYIIGTLVWNLFATGERVLE
ncbi:Ascorbate transporter [Citrus sinensis]|uniref:ascorbate transporter, chloroplastic isoform X2 n=1 Tax=Citrus sinensis TaxID=2711 RepID=UPI002190D691|nr:ascorbate transporter, chloroplastic isoform X2 [Citrus sinensis]XP_052293697.1 ascorbate transporter, chloroplastic-like isoform X2 [Citrus sinensis]KAH9731918.1 Ascorbate transporter [Citrus sinensis]KAH9732621.1 Ascorbate transporter [Citrus sinensis]